jgi:hypothetical protein
MKPKQQDTITVGLFGTCGNSNWRAPFIELFEKTDISFFNPVVPNWDDSFAEIEAQHLVEDEIILFPVTDETTGFGSLAETGYSISQALRSNSERFVIIYIAPNVNEALQISDPIQAKESKKARALTLAHMKRQAATFPNVYIVDSMEKMLEITLPLYFSMVNMKIARKNCMY